LKIIKTFALLIIAFLAVQVTPQIAQCQDELRNKVQNPVGSLYSLPFKNTFDFGASDGSGAYTLNIQLG